jgi:hypothetical protein
MTPPRSTRSSSREAIEVRLDEVGDSHRSRISVSRETVDDPRRFTPPSLPSGTIGFT